MRTGEHRSRRLRPIPSLCLCVVAAQLLSLSGCNQCGKSNIEKQGEAVVWERISFGIDEETFLDQAALLGSLPAAPGKGTACREQLSMLYPELDEGVIEERTAGDRALARCVVQSDRVSQTATLLETKGEFIDHRLSRVSYRFVPTQRQIILETLQARLGEGDTIRVLEQTIIDDAATTYRYWQDDNEVWLLGAANERDALLIRQDHRSGEWLRKPTPVPRRGVPVSLEDIGIGELDLKAPPPDLSLLDALKDAGPAPRGSAPESSGTPP